MNKPVKIIPVINGFIVVPAEAMNTWQWNECYVFGDAIALSQWIRDNMEPVDMALTVHTGQHRGSPSGNE